MGKKGKGKRNRLLVKPHFVPGALLPCVRASQLCGDHAGMWEGRLKGYYSRTSWWLLSPPLSFFLGWRSEARRRLWLWITGGLHLLKLTSIPCS